MYKKIFVLFAIALLFCPVLADTIAFNPVPITKSIPDTFRYTVYTADMVNTSFVLANVTYSRTDLVVTNCFKNNTNLNGISFSIVNLSSTTSSLTINATNTSQLFNSGASLESLFDIQYYYYNMLAANNDSIPFDQATTQWYGNDSTIDAGFNAFDTRIDGWINTTGVNGFVEAPINMTALYALTITVTGASTGLPVPDATVSDATQSNTTGANGVTTLFEPYGTAAGTLSANGYDSRVWSTFVDENMERTYMMTKSTNIGQNTNVIWSPFAVAIQVIDGNMNPIIGVPVTMSAYNSSLPGGLAGAVEYFKNTYGVPEDTAAAMLNASTEYSGTTDDYGFISTQVVSVIQYKIVTQDVKGTPIQRLLWPHGSYYQINTGNVTTPGLIQMAEIQDEINTMSKYNATFWKPNSSYGCMGVKAYDHTGGTTNVYAWWKLVDNGTIWWENSTAIGGYGPVNSTKCVPIVPYQQWKWGGITN